jgi:hypothetical protein
MVIKKIIADGFTDGKDASVILSFITNGFTDGLIDKNSVGNYLKTFLKNYFIKL